MISKIYKKYNKNYKNMIKIFKMHLYYQELQAEQKLLFLCLIIYLSNENIMIISFKVQLIFYYIYSTYFIVLYVLNIQNVCEDFLI